MRPIPSVRPDQLDELEFDELIDVRAPAEFAEDHLPGAINLPVLDDSQRAEVGTIFKQRSPFEARRLGGGLASANIAKHVADHLADKPRDYRPLIYCWRGGERSGSMATVLNAIGWKVSKLEGGYKAYRAHVVELLGKLLANRPRLRIIAGLTGSGKTLLLERLSRAGEQVVDLEGLAAHRGSALGSMPDAPQPSQKLFERRLLEVLQSLDFDRPIYVESESNRIGNIQVPGALWPHMKAAPVIEISTSRRARAEFLTADYDYFLRDRELLLERMEPIRRLQPTERFALWEQQIAAEEWREFVESILEHHYDPAYLRSRARTFHLPGQCFEFDAVSENELDALVRRIVDGELDLRGEPVGAENSTS